MIDEKLKQRLAGAIALSTLAIILIPMLFDEEVQQSSIAMQNIPEFPKSFEDNIVKIPSQREISEKIKRSKDGLHKLNDKVKKQVKAWVVQVGSFAKEENAVEFRNKLKKAGFVAFVESTDNTKGKLFRVRVGPELNYERTEKMQERIEIEFDLKGIIVSYPN